MGQTGPLQRRAGPAHHRQRRQHAQHADRAVVPHRAAAAGGDPVRRPAAGGHHGGRCCRLRPPRCLGTRHRSEAMDSHASALRLLNPRCEADDDATTTMSHGSHARILPLQVAVSRPRSSLGDPPEQGVLASRPAHMVRASRRVDGICRRRARSLCSSQNAGFQATVAALLSWSLLRGARGCSGRKPAQQCKLLMPLPRGGRVERGVGCVMSVHPGLTDATLKRRQAGRM